MKKIVNFVLFILMIFCLFACSNDDITISNENDASKISSKNDISEFVVPTDDEIKKAEEYLSQVLIETNAAKSINVTDYRILYRTSDDEPIAIAFEFGDKEGLFDNGYAIVYIKSDIKPEGFDLKVYSFNARSPYKNVPDDCVCYYGGVNSYLCKYPDQSEFKDVWDVYPVN